MVAITRGVLVKTVIRVIFSSFVVGLLSHGGGFSKGLLSEDLSGVGGSWRGSPSAGSWFVPMVGCCCCCCCCLFLRISKLQR